MECGIDCFSTVRADMDLANVSNTLEFTRLMDEFDPKGVEGEDEYKWRRRFV